jgi:hypothetical protein
MADFLQLAVRAFKLPARLLGLAHPLDKHRKEDGTFEIEAGSSVDRVRVPARAAKKLVEFPLFRR